MKFLKAFLFTISFCFIFGSIMSIAGYCEAAPVLSPDSSSLSVIQGGGMPYYYSMNGYGEMYFMTPEFNQGLNDFGVACEDWLEHNTGYNSDQLITMAPVSMVEQIDEAGFGSGNPSGGLSASTAQWFANRMTNNTLQTAGLALSGYSILKQSVPQWGSNAYQWFLGKINSSTGVISDVCNNFVTKITSEGINNYLDAYSSLIQNGDIVNLTTEGYLFGKTISFYDSSLNRVYYLEFPRNIVFFNNPSGTDYKLVCRFSDASNSSYGYYVDISSGLKTEIEAVWGDTVSIWFNNQWTTFEYLKVKPTVGNVSSWYPMFRTSSNISGFNFSKLSGSQVAASLNYSSNGGASIRSLLEQLIGLYVDNNTMNDIVNIIREIPVETQTVNGEPVPIANPSAENVEDLESIIQQAIDNSILYRQVIEPYEESEPLPDPEPAPNNQGTEVPEDFPTIIFSPINDSVGSIFDFVSIFEPLFYIFSFSTGLLGLWLVVPFVILFLILFRLLK